MKKFNLFITLMLLTVLASFGQFTVTTVPPLAGTNGNDGVTFGVTSTQTILIDTIYCTFTGTGTTEIWVTTTDLTGPPTITTANGWTNLGTATIATATAFGSVVAIPLNLGYTVLPTQNYRFAVN